MCTGGVYRPFWHDRHFSAASNFQIGVSRGRPMASNGRLACVRSDGISLAAVEALSDGRGGPSGPTVSFHLDSTIGGCGSVGLTDGHLCGLANILSTYLGPDNLTTVNNLSGLRTHGRHYSAARGLRQSHSDWRAGTARAHNGFVNQRAQRQRGLLGPMAARSPASRTPAGRRPHFGPPPSVQFNMNN